MNTRILAHFLGLLISLIVFSPAVQAQRGKGLHLLKSTVVGGEGGWDYLVADDATKRLYLSHSDRVEVLDLATHKYEGYISPTPGVHGIAVASKEKLGYITCGKTNSVAMFDLQSLTILKTIPAGKKPDAILYDIFSSRVFVFNNAGASATVLDARSGDVVDSIALGGAPEAAVTNRKGTIYVNLEDKAEVVAFDAITLKVKQRFPLPGGEEPTGLAIDLKLGRLFSACHNELLFILDLSTGAVLDKKPIGARVDGAVFDPKHEVAITSNGSGTMTVVKETTPGHFEVTETVTTQLGARTITIDPKSHHVYTVSAEYGPKPEPTTENPRPRAPILPKTFTVMEYGFE